MSIHSEIYTRKDAYNLAETIYDSCSKYNFEDEILNNIDIAQIASSIIQTRYDEDRIEAKIERHKLLEENYIKSRKSGIEHNSFSKEYIIPETSNASVMIAGLKTSSHNWKMCKKIYLKLIMDCINVQICDFSQLVHSKKVSRSWGEQGVPIKELEDFYKYMINKTKHQLEYPNIAAYECITSMVYIHLNIKSWVNFFKTSKIKTLITTIRTTQPIPTIILAANICKIRTIELMHGVGAPYNINYSYKYINEDDLKKGRKHNMFPEILATTHNRTKNLIESTWCINTKKKNKVVVIDEQYENWDSSYKKIKDDKKGEKNINYKEASLNGKLKVLVIGQWGGEQKERLKLLTNKQLLLASSNGEIELVFRPHPLALKSDLSILNRLAMKYLTKIDMPNSECKNDSSIMKTISECNIVIGGFSSALISCLKQEKFVLTYGRAARDNFVDILNHNSMLNFPTIELLVEFLLKFGENIVQNSIVIPSIISRTSKEKSTTLKNILVN